MFIKSDIWAFSKYLSRAFKFRKNLARIACTLQEDRWTFLKISRWILVRTRNISERVAEKIKARFMFNKLFLKSCPLWDNMAKYSRARIGHRRQYGACALHAGYLTVHTLTICNTHCFSTATAVPRTQLTVTVLCTLSVLFSTNFVQNVFRPLQWRTDGEGLGVQTTPPEIPKFWQSWAEFPVPWKIQP
jgi:hypothetical protein